MPRVSCLFLKISVVSLYYRMARTRGGAFGGDAPGASAWGRRRPRGRGRAASPARDMEEEPHAAHVPPQPVGPGPAQPPPAPVAAPDLHSLLTQILAAFEDRAPDFERLAALCQVLKVRVLACVCSILEARGVQGGY